MIAQAAPQNLPLTKHRGAKLLRPQMFPAAAMVDIGIVLCLLAHHYTSQNNGDPNATNSSDYAFTNTSPNPDDSNASGAATNEMEDNSNSIANLASSLGLQVIAYAKENEGSKEYGCYSSLQKHHRTKLMMRVQLRNPVQKATQKLLQKTLVRKAMLKYQPGKL